MTSRTIKAVKGTVTSLVSYGVLVLLQAVLAPIVLKTAGQEVLGAYSIIMQIIGYGLILDFGIGVALSRYLAHSFGEDDQGDRFSTIFNIGRYFILATNMLLAVFILVLIRLRLYHAFDA